jgi:hypothetical protein
LDAPRQVSAQVIKEYAGEDGLKYGTFKSWLVDDDFEDAPPEQSSEQQQEMLPSRKSDSGMPEVGFGDAGGRVQGVPAVGFGDAKYGNPSVGNPSTSAVRAEDPELDLPPDNDDFRQAVYLFNSGTPGNVWLAQMAAWVNALKREGHVVTCRHLYGAIPRAKQLAKDGKPRKSLIDPIGEALNEVVRGGSSHTRTHTTDEYAPLPQLTLEERDRIAMESLAELKALGYLKEPVAL